MVSGLFHKDLYEYGLGCCTSGYALQTLDKSQSHVVRTGEINCCNIQNIKANCKAFNSNAPK